MVAVEDRIGGLGNKERPTSPNEARMPAVST
jgi:hypothetical protein